MRTLTTITLGIIFMFSTVSWSQNARTTITPSAGEFSVANYTDKEVILNHNTRIHITAANAKTALVNSVVQLNTLDSWVYFDNIRPQVVIDSLLKFFSINGQNAVQNTNTRVSIYKHGTVVIPHSSQFQPLTVFTDQNFVGDSASFSLFTFNKNLGTFDNSIRSFKLKRGYMATLANSSDGTGYSRVFIADNADLQFNVMPDLLDRKVSFIRVLRWDWPSKKGWAGSDFNQYNKTQSTWRYDWSAGGNTSNYVEYVPIKQNAGWPGWSEISNKQYVSHVLGFNEPDQSDQANMKFQTMIDMWPDFMRTGLRIGSPAFANPWNAANGGTLFDFIKKCEELNYRVDFVALHCYWGGKSPQNWYNDLKSIHQQVKRPLWITEWNNGANWTNETWPTADRSLSTANATKQLNDIKGILTVLDTASFIERYSIYNWVQDCRAMVLNNELTPAGAYYAENKPGTGFNKKYEVIPGFRFGDPTLNISFGSKNITLTETDPNSEFFEGMIIEKNVDDKEWQEYYNSENPVRTAIDTFDANVGSKFRYKVRARLPNNVLTIWSPETGFDFTNNADIQCGKLSYNNVGWNAVFFGKSFSTIPSIILGAPTNANTNVLMSPRVRLINSSTRFNAQLAPWAYQNVTSLSKEETVPYLAIAPGTYDFGGLKAITGRNTANGSSWTTVTFAEPFDTVPVVFATQLLATSTYATTARVRNVTKTGFELRIQKEATVTTVPGNESVSYFAIAPGTGMMDGRKVVVGRTANNFISPTLYRTIMFNDSIADPIFFGQLQTCNDDSITAVLRVLSLSSKYATVIKQRERSQGTITAQTESAGWMLIDPLSVVQGVKNVPAGSLEIYPNPAGDLLNVRNAPAWGVDVEVYNLSGVLVRRYNKVVRTIDVAGLSPGYYILRDNRGSSTGFVKQ